MKRLYRIFLILAALGLLAPAQAEPLPAVDEIQALLVHGEPAEIEQLLAQGMDANLLFPDGNSALTVATREGNVEVVKLLLNHGARVYARNRYDETAIMLAAWHGHDDIIDMLLAWGAELGPNRKGWTPLIYAAHAGRCDTLYHLLDLSTAEVDIKTSAGMTALMYAAREGHPECVKSLLRAGADMDVRTPSGKTAAKLAASTGNTDIAELLLISGAQE